LILGACTNLAPVRNHASLKCGANRPCVESRCGQRKRPAVLGDGPTAYPRRSALTLDTLDGSASTAVHPRTHCARKRSVASRGCSQPAPGMAQALMMERAVSLHVITCTGLSGAKYTYYSADQGSTWLSGAGNYLFCKWNGCAWMVQYAGECGSFAARMPNHERWEEGVRDYGVTQAFSHITEGGEKARQTEEQDIIRAYNPPMNVQHRTDATARDWGAGLSPLAQSLLRGRK
jgi:hypothetical protein